MEKHVPEFLIEMLNQQYGEEITSKILEGYLKKRMVTFRVNTLKTSIEKVEEVLEKYGLDLSVRAEELSEEILVDLCKNIS